MSAFTERFARLDEKSLNADVEEGMRNNAAAQLRDARFAEIHKNMEDSMPDGLPSQMMDMYNQVALQQIRVGM